MDIKNLINLIRSTPVENMDDQFILDLGLNDEVLNEQPAEYSQYFGKGLKIWQYPNQISPFLKGLNKTYVNSYMEIGVRHGGTFILMLEFLAKFNPSIIGYACDLTEMSDILKEYRKYRNFVYLSMDSKSEEFKRICNTNFIDFVFIDGCHLYESVSSDFNIFKNKPETKHIVLHDIDSYACRGTTRFWNEVQNTNQYLTKEYCAQYDSVKNNYLGIGYIYKND